MSLVGSRSRLALLLAGVASYPGTPELGKVPVARSTALQERRRRRRRAHFHQFCGLKSKSPLALSRWFCYLCPLRSSCRTPTPPSAQESALPGAPAPTLVPRHLTVTKPSHSHLKEENDNKFLTPTQAPPGITEQEKRRGLKEATGRWMPSGAGVAPVRVCLAAGTNYRGRRCFPDWEEPEAVFMARTPATPTLAWSKFPQGLVSLARRQVGSASQVPSTESTDSRDQFQGAGRLRRRGPLLPLPLDRSPCAQLSLSSRSRESARRAHARYL